jgi:hypothetical protein
VSSSRFVAEFASIKKAEAAVSRFLVSHPKLSRFIAHIPGASKFLKLAQVALVGRSLGDGGTVPHVAPVYNARARRPRIDPPRFS